MLRSDSPVSGMRPLQSAESGNWLLALREKQERTLTFGSAPAKQVRYQPAAQQDDFLRRLQSAEARDHSNSAMARQTYNSARPFQSSSHLHFQRNAGEALRAGQYVAQPVGGRMHRQLRVTQSARSNEWTEADECAFMKAFGRSSSTPAGPRPTGA